MKFQLVGNTKIIVIVILVVILLFVIGCTLGVCCKKNKAENSMDNFENGCAKEYNYQDPNFKNQRYFHYDNIGRLVPSNPVHVNREVVQSALLGNGDLDTIFGDAKKKRQSP